MAFANVAATNTSSDASTTSHTVSLPASIIAQDLLLVFMACDSGITFTTPAGWTLEKTVDDAAGNNLTTFSKVASGSEGATLAVTSSGSTTSAHISYRLDAYEGTIDVSTGATGTDVNPDPANLNPAADGASDYLWIALACNDNAAFTGYPSSYTGDNLTSVGGNRIGVATRDLNATQENPGTFTIGGSADWVAYTISISPPSDISGDVPLLVSSSTIPQVTITYPADADLDILTSTSTINSITSNTETVTQWTNDSKPSTTWSNLDKN